MQKNSRVVVFGATGLVGSAIVRKLLEKGYKNIIGTYLSKSAEELYKGYEKYIKDGSLKFKKVNLTSQKEK